MAVLSCSGSEGEEVRMPLQCAGPTTECECLFHIGSRYIPVEAGAEESACGDSYHGHGCLLPNSIKYNSTLF